MVKKEVRIVNKLGLHARPAALFVKTSAKFKSEVFIDKEGFEINAKSIMGVMLLAAEHGSKLILRCEGPDEEECINQLIKLIEDKFYEE